MNWEEVGDSEAKEREMKCFLYPRISFAHHRKRVLERVNGSQDQSGKPSRQLFQSEEQLEGLYGGLQGHLFGTPKS